MMERQPKMENPSSCSPEQNREMVCWVKDILAGNTSFLEQLNHGDWARFPAFARKHGIAPVLYLALKDIPDSSPRRKYLGELRNIYRAEAQNNLFLYHELGKILKALHTAGLSVIVLKGACLAEAVYGNIALRPMSDVDFLVKKRDLNHTVLVLKSCGYEADYDFLVDKEVAADLHHHLPPLKGPTGLQLEIHWTIFNYDFFEACDEAEREVVNIWQRARPLILEDMPCLMLAPEDLFLHLCIHISRQHVFDVRLRHLLDLRKVCECYGNTLDWEVIYQRACHWRADRAVTLTVLLAERLIGMAVPERVKRTWKTELPDPGVLQWVEEKTLAESTHLTLPRFVARKSLKDKCGSLWKQLFPPPSVLARWYSSGLNPTGMKIYFFYPKYWYHIGKKGWRIVWSIFGNRSTVLPSLQKEEALLHWLAQT